MSRILLVDGSNLVYKFFDNSAPADIPTMIGSHVSRIASLHQPERVVIAWDDREGCFRKDSFPDYKAGREPKEGIGDVIVETQIETRERWEMENVWSPRFEADDVIATLVNQAAGEAKQSIIYSTDRDMHQLLLRGWVTQLVSFKSVFGRDHQEWRTHDGEHGIIDRYGVSPEQWVDYRCMTGDSSDNIAGFPGVGEKGAVEVLKKWGTLDAYFEAPDRFKLAKRFRKPMEAGRDLLQELRSLITLRTDVEIQDIAFSEQVA